MRLLVVRDEASAVVDRFALIQGGREAVVVPSTEQAPTGGGFDAALVDVGSAREGLEVARRLRGRDPNCPTVVIGTEEPTGAELPDGVWLLLRPFTLADLDRRLRELTAATIEAEEPDPGLLSRLFGRHSEPPQPTSSDRNTEPATDAAGVRADADAAHPAPDIVEPLADEPEAHRDPPADASRPVDKPRVHRRLRATPDPSVVPDEIAGAVQAARDLVTFLGRNPRSVDRPTFAAHVLDETDARLVADVISLWAAEPAGGYALLAAAGAGDRLARSARVTEGQRLFSEIRDRSDAVLITGARAGHPALEGIPVDPTPTVLAVALRAGHELEGVLLVGGDDLRTDDRDRLAALAQRAGPQLRLARLVETLRHDRLVVLPEEERVEGGPRH